MPETNVQTATNFDEALVRSVDFANQFSDHLTSLRTLLSTARLLPMAEGSVIKTYKSTATLAGGTVEPGEIIPLSKVEKKLDKTYELVWKKHRKATPIEVIQSFGWDTAVDQTDGQMLRELQKGIRDDFMTQLGKGTGKVTAEGLQKTAAMAWAGVVTAFEDDDVDQPIAFINPTDAAKYLGDAAITTQTAFGMSYLENFLNFRVVFMHSAVPAGTMYATAAQNLVVAYATLGGRTATEFDLTKDEHGLIGVTHDTNKQRMQAEIITISAIVMFAENLNGVIVGTIAEPAAPDAGA